MGKFITKKKFGQNFLQDEKIINGIVNELDITDEDLIIEIGPGQGALTKYLTNKGAALLCFEIDEETKPYLMKYQNDHTRIIYKDFLQVNLNDYINKEEYNHIYVIANLPYYITTPIIEKVMQLDIITQMVLMVQNEVADRFCAKPGTKDYGLFTVKLNYFYDVVKVLFVNRNCFKPSPNVDSAVVKFSANKKNGLKSYETLEKLLKKSFMMKRKTLKNNLGIETYNILKPILDKYNYPDDVRAEGVSIDHFIEMSNELN